MAKLNSNMLLGIFVAIALVAIIYYLNRNDDRPIPNEGAIDMAAAQAHSSKTSTSSSNNVYRPANPPMIDNRKRDDVSNSLVDDLIAQYTVEDRPMEGGVGSFSPEDPMASNYGAFNDYGRKRQLNFKQMEQAYPDDDFDPRDFSYKKKRFTKRTPDDVKELFNINAMLPEEIQQDWFDVEPLLTTKKIKGTHLIHPKVHMGVNTVGNSLKNGTHDLRGDIANPKMNVSPWMNSTIEPDTNLKGICNPI
jgi:hypothetical protein